MKLYYVIAHHSRIPKYIVDKFAVFVGEQLNSPVFGHKEDYCLREIVN